MLSYVYCEINASRVLKIGSLVNYGQTSVAETG